MRTNVFLAAVAGLLAVPTTITILSERSSFTRYEDVPRLFEGFTPEKIAFVQLSKVKLDGEGEPVKAQNGQLERETLTLQKSTDGWVIGSGQIAGAPVRANFVAERILGHVEAIRRDADSLVASRADGEEGYDEALKDFELTEELGTLVVCADARRQPVAELYKGRSPRKSAAGDSLNGYFVRRKDRDDVILYEDPAWATPMMATQWIERAIVPRTDAGRVVRIAVKNQQGQVAFKKDAVTDTTWQAITMPDGAGAVRTQEVDNLVTRAARFQVTEYVQKLPPNRAAALKPRGLETPAITLELELDDGTIYAFAFGDKLTDKNEYYATVSSFDFLLTLPSYAFDNLEFDPETLFDPSDESVAPKDDDKDEAPVDAGQDGDAGKKNPDDENPDDKNPDDKGPNKDPEDKD